MEFIYNDGGRAEAGYKGTAGDCVTRAIAIVTGKPYQEVYNRLFEGIGELAKGRSREAKRAARGGGRRGTTPRNGVSKKVYHRYLTEELGMTWVPTMDIGTGCKVHLEADELPKGRIIVRLSKHLAAVVDGVLHDTYDCSNRGVTTMNYTEGMDIPKGWHRGNPDNNENDGVVIHYNRRCVYGYYTF